MVLLRTRALLTRTLLAFFPSLAKPDDAFAEAQLTPAEHALYAQMDARERDHACQVAKAVVSRVPDASPYLVRAALLHDVGKSAVRYNPWERIFVHLYTPKTVPVTPRLRGLRGVWQRRRHHGRFGAELICRAGGDARVAEIVARHHHPDGNAEAAQLKAVEETF